MYSGLINSGGLYNGGVAHECLAGTVCGIWLIVGIGVGTALGVATGFDAIGLALGALAGLVAGAVMGQRRRGLRQIPRWP